MSIEIVNDNDKVYESDIKEIIKVKVARDGYQVRIMCDIEKDFINYIRFHDIPFDSIPVMLNEETTFILECFIEMYGEEFMYSDLFKNGKEFLIGEYAINKENDVFLSMDWNPVADCLTLTERQKGFIDMLYYGYYRKFSDIGSGISMMLEQEALNAECKYRS